MVQIDFDGTEVGSATTDGSGAFQRTIEIPPFALPGLHQVMTSGEASGLTTKAPFRVRTNWVQFRSGPRHTGYNPYENVLSPSNASSLKMKWQAGTGQFVLSSPAVVKGVV